MNFSLLSTMLLALALSSVSSFYVVHAQNSSFSALFAFGDSILDTGNNNLLPTLSKCNFFPYGRNFIGGRPTGRFGNGRVFSDIIAEGLGIKPILPAYRDPSLSNNDLPTGVCFASGGSGLDDRTPRITAVLSIQDQLNDFKDYTAKLNGVVGSQANAVISNAVFLISAGNNDLAIAFPTRMGQYTVFSYTDLLITYTQNLVKSLYDMGARKFAIMGTLPLGCLPGATNTFGNVLKMCQVPANQLATMFNQKLSALVDNIGTQFAGAKFAYVDMYNPLLNIINNPMASGFIDARDGCCCTPTSIVPCLDASRYVFWDIAHPTERSYLTIAPSIVADLKPKLA
ncbi:unnamed protein product [Thlaspi arvense]|uniref:GDSL esterase/lipase n=1 Tax=Thlaspi arvense TaxID=13288 RepID=A0AAU9R4U5_THLAR|nr:unnamed protein product [Thlaspi arvense]